VRALPVLLLLAAGSAPGAPPLPEALTAHLARTPLLHAGFTQTRTLAALSRPLRSSGTLVVSREHGVLWQVVRPLVLTVVVTPAGLTEVDAAGARTVRSARDQPMVAHMARIMKSLLEGRWEALDDLFTVRAGGGGPDRWTVTLVPRPRTAAFLRGVTVSGARFLERIQVEEANGDRMELVFDHPRADLPLSRAEARLFVPE
jgi:hypothetical protein